MPSPSHTHKSSSVHCFGIVPCVYLATNNIHRGLWAVPWRAGPGWVGPREWLNQARYQIQPVSYADHGPTQVLKKNKIKHQLPEGRALRLFTSSPWQLRGRWGNGVCVHAHVWVARQESGRSREEREWWRRNGWIVVRRVVGVAIVSLIVPPLLIKGAGLICSGCCYTIKAAIEDLKGFLQAFALGTCVCSGGFILYIPGCKHSVDVSVHVQVCVCILETTRLEGHMPSSHHAASPLMSDGKWSGHSVKRACRFNSPAHTSDPVNQTIRAGEEQDYGGGEESVSRKKRKKEGGNKLHWKIQDKMVDVQPPNAPVASACLCVCINASQTTALANVICPV